MIKLIYRNNRHPPFHLNYYLYAYQTYRTHSPKRLRLLQVYNHKSTAVCTVGIYELRQLLCNLIHN